MRKISGTQLCAISFLISQIAITVPSAKADSYNNGQLGLNLPPLVAPYGQDEVRAMDGTYCRSSIANSGAYMDMGVVGNGAYDDGSGAGAVYGRVGVPLGKRPGRIDCSTLYDLEVQRLRLELQLTRMGVGNAGVPSQKGDWQTKGWSTEGRAQVGQTAQ